MDRPSLRVGNPVDIRGATRENMDEFSRRRADRKRIYIGVFLICVSVLLMVFGEDVESRIFQVFWVILLGLGILFYLWGRFFSRKEP